MKEDGTMERRKKREREDFSKSLRDLIQGKGSFAFPLFPVLPAVAIQKSSFPFQILSGSFRRRSLGPAKGLSRFIGLWPGLRRSANGRQRENTGGTLICLLKERERSHLISDSFRKAASFHV